MEIDEKELAGLRRKAGKYDKDTALDEAERDRFIKLMDAEQGKDRADAEKWRKVEEIAASDYCSRCFNRFKCPSDDYAPCPFKDILEEVEGEKG